MLTLLLGVMQQFGNIPHHISHLKTAPSSNRTCSREPQTKQCGKCCSERKKEKQPCERPCKLKQHQTITYMVCDWETPIPLVIPDVQTERSFPNREGLTQSISIENWKPPQVQQPTTI
jgi:hypothetical protein